MWIHLTIPFTVVFCADRFGLGQPGRMPASVNAMRVLSTSTDLEAAVADALVRGKIQNASNTGKCLKVTCTYVLLFLNSFILIVPVWCCRVTFCCFVFWVLAAVCFSLFHVSSLQLLSDRVLWVSATAAGWVKSPVCLSLGCQSLETWQSEISISPITCRKILSEQQCSLLVWILDQVSARTSFCPVLFVPGWILRELITWLAWNLYHLVQLCCKLNYICLVCC